MARPTKLTPETKKRILDMIRAGVPASTACRTVQITEATYYNWIKRGEEEAARRDDGITAAERREQGLPSAASERLFLEFFEDLDRADAEGEARVLLEINKAGKKQWQAHAWLAERRWRDRWGRTTRTEVTGADGGPVDVRGVPDAELEALAASLAAAAAFGGVPVDAEPTETNPAND